MAVATRYEIEVSYNGVTRNLAIETHESVVSVLQRAIQLFGITQQPHLLSLFTASNQVVDERESAGRAGLTPGVLVYLRPNVVKGG
jgi:hypothetical protein